MLIPTQNGYTNLGTISEAEMHGDGGVTLHWGTHAKRYNGRDAVVIRQALDMLAGLGGAPREAGLSMAHEEEEGLDQQWAATEEESSSAPRTLKLHAQESLFGEEVPEPPLSATRSAEVNEAVDESGPDDEAAKHESALLRRAHLVMKYEPIASLSHKLRGVFLAAIEKAADFNHLAPKFRRLIQEAESRRREDLRQ